jgi:predicted RNA-binding Zn ribbon-like protein
MRIGELADGGAPLLGEPLPLELGNATYAARGVLRDGLTTPAHLGAWLRDVRSRLSTRLTDAQLLACTAEDLATARDLRDCIRALADAAVHGTRPAPSNVAALNAHVRAAPRWRELSWRSEPVATERSTAPPVRQALGEIAAEAVNLFSGPDREQIRACPAPGCVLYFLRQHARREWCSATCGNRVRAARHYDRISATGPDR